MLWAFLFLVLNLSFVCLQRSSWYRTIESVQVAVRVNSIEASVFSAALNCLPITWLQKNAFSRCLSQLLRPPFIFFADLFLMSTWYESKKSLQVTFRDEPCCDVARCFLFPSCKSVDYSSLELSRIIIERKWKPISR